MIISYQSILRTLQFLLHFGNALYLLPLLVLALLTTLIEYLLFQINVEVHKIIDQRLCDTFVCCSGGETYGAPGACAPPPQKKLQHAHCDPPKNYTKVCNM